MSKTATDPPLWPADKVERRPVDTLIPFAKNSRTHSDVQIAQIAASIREWGFTNPILIDPDGTIIAGHARALAARKLGLTDIPVMIAHGWTEAQRRAYVIADNKLAMNAGWDDDLLKLELADLKGMEFDLSQIGFDADELGSLLLVDKTAGLTDPDEAPPPPVNPVSRLGDVWLLGNHRLAAGSSTDADTVAKALNGVKPHLMVTDPPYGVEYDPAWRDKAAASGKLQRYGKNVGVGLVSNDHQTDWSEAWALFPGDVAYVWCAPGPLQCTVHDSLGASGIEVRQQIIWAKNQFAIGRGNYHYQHEVCWYAVRKNKTSHYNGDRKQSTIWQIDKPKTSETGHSTQKPVEAMRRPIENNSSPGQAVYEPFSGSGTTIIAGEMTGRSVHAIELNPTYVDVAVKRWQEFTGQTAGLEETGQSFAEVADERYDAAALGSYENAVSAVRERFNNG